MPTVGLLEVGYRPSSRFYSVYTKHLNAGVVTAYCSDVGWCPTPATAHITATAVFPQQPLQNLRHNNNNNSLIYQK